MLRFDYHCATLHIPDGYVGMGDDLQKEFLEWVEDQPGCVVKGLNGVLALSYNEVDFLKYTNEVLLKNSKEKAYLLPDSGQVKSDRTISF